MLDPVDACGLWAVDLTYAPVLTRALADRPSASVPRPKAVSALEYIPSTTRKEKRVAAIQVAGLLTRGQTWYGTSTVQLRKDIRQAVADPSVSGILLVIDSPGGTAAGTPELAAEVQQAKRKKPVWAHVSDLAASAAYWVASQADQVWSNPTGVIGSVGTIVQVEDASGALEKAGVQIHTFSTGELKAAGKFGTPMTDAMRSMIQALVDDSQVLFDQAIKTARGLSPEQLAEVRKGGVYPPTAAQALRLIDGIRPLERTVQMLADSR